MTNDERMTKLKARRGFVRCAGLFVILLSMFAAIANAQEGEPLKKTGEQLLFVPPPMEGTISLGIYDATGKLVRVLHQEAQQSEFYAALNGLITYWDGKDDSGKVMPAGKYRAKGFMVGDMDFDGVAFLGNDWVTDENSPRIKSIIGISTNKEGNLVMLAQQGDNSRLRITCDTSGSIAKKEVIEEPAAQPPGDASGGPGIPALGPSAVTIQSGTIVYAGTELKIPSLTNPIDAWQARDDGIWLIDRNADGSSEIKQFSSKGEFKRRMAIPAADPAPVKIVASAASDTIFLLETKTGLQRIRALTLESKTDTGAADASSLWKVTFSKTIRASETLNQVSDLLKLQDGKPFVPQDKIRLTLLPNPLEQDKPGAVDISIGVDAKGSFLKAGDGLPLCRVSETPNLRWAAMAREPDSKIITIFQSDGAVVEQFKASKLANMMAFDCGEFTLGK